MRPTGRPLYGAEAQAHREAARLKRERRRAALRVKNVTEQIGPLFGAMINPRTGHGPIRGKPCPCYECLYGAPEEPTPRIARFLGLERA
jgi:hypothetical protein